MTALRTLFSAVADAMTPDGMILRMRFRTTLDLLVTAVVTVLAIGLAIGFQVVGRWARRSGWVD